MTCQIPCDLEGGLTDSKICGGTEDERMGFNVFCDDWNRLESGELYLSDCTGLDRRLDRKLIEYIAIHGQGWWMPKFRRRYRLEETFPETADKDDPDGYWRRYCMLKEQAAREDDRDVLKKAAFKYDENRTKYVQKPE